MTDQEFTGKLEQAKNAAKNGRLFCTLLFILCIIGGLYVGALLAAVSVGLACLADGLTDRHARVRSFIALVAYGLPVGTAIAFLIKFW